VTVLLVVLAVKSVVLAWGVGAARHGELSTHDYECNYHHHRIIGRYEQPPRFDFFELWVASDAQWYNAIAEDGYPSREQFDEDETTARPKLIATTDTQLKYVFFPMWPLVIRGMRQLIPDVNAAGFVAANLISMLAMMVLYGFLAHRAGRQTAFWTVVLLAASPFALFLDVPFTESLFLLLTVLTFVACERHCWPAAGVLIGLSMITRPTGLALITVPLVYAGVELVRRREEVQVHPLRMLWLLVAVVPPALFLWHNAVKTGDPLYFTIRTKPPWSLHACPGTGFIAQRSTLSS
jgi:hypothetical protein